jgi:hypothetical protein
VTRTRRAAFLRHDLVVAVAAALVTGLVAGYFTLHAASKGDVVLISVSVSQADGFVPQSADPAPPSAQNTPATFTHDSLHPGATQGTRPGAYGRTGSGVTCAVETIVRYLSTHRPQEAAWAGVHNIAPAAVPTYLRGLTPVRLRADTRVTNYDYKDAHADGFQAVLQAGTAVLVDARGVPRAKCNCGNPLAEPTASDDIRNPANAWPGFDKQRLVRFTAGRPVRQLVLVDLDDGGAYRRAVGSPGGHDAAVRRGDPACTDLADSTSCGGPGPIATALDRAALERAIRGLTDAVRDNDCGALLRLLSARTVTRFGLDAASCKDAFDYLAQDGGITIDKVTVVSQHGAEAVIEATVTVTGHTSTERDRMLRENGTWKIDIT